MLAWCACTPVPSPAPQKPDMAAHICNLPLVVYRPAQQCTLIISFVGSLRPAWDTFDPVLKFKKKKKKVSWAIAEALVEILHSTA